MSFLLWILFGAIAGWLASMIMGRNQGVGMDILFGIIGSIAGGFLMQQLGEPGVTGFNLYSILVAVVGAIAVIWIGRLFRRTA